MMASIFLIKLSIWRQLPKLRILNQQKQKGTKIKQGPNNAKKNQTSHVLSFGKQHTLSKVGVVVSRFVQQ